MRAGFHPVGKKREGREERERDFGGGGGGGGSIYVSGATIYKISKTTC